MSPRSPHGTSPRGWAAFTLRLPPAALLGLVLSACAGEQRRPNILFISLDACRADHLGSYGYSRDTSPFLDELARRGTRFTHAFVNSHGTPTSHTTMFSSLYQETHRVAYNDQKGAAHFAVPPQVKLLPEHLRQHGYLTLGVTDGGWLLDGLGWGRGFDEFWDEGKGVVSGTTRLLEMIRRRRDDERPIFAFYHTYEIHSPYLPPAEYRAMFGERAPSLEPTSENLLAINAGRLPVSEEDLQGIVLAYDRGVRFTDDTLRRFFADLEAEGFFEDSLVVITGDHGEELFEHGGFAHRKLLYDELLHVPLIVVGSGVPAGEVDSRMVSTIDLAPTILDRAGIEIDSLMEGRSLLAPPAPEEGEEAILSQCAGYRYSLRTRRWKYIENTSPPSVELYDLLEDPRESRNVAQRFPDRVESFRERLAARKAALHRGEESAAKDSTLSPEERERLRTLGYVD